MKTRKYWTQTITYPIGPDVNLVLRLRIIRGILKQFSVVFKHKIGNEWSVIKRCDNTEKHGGIPHCHIYKLNSKSRKDIIGSKQDNMGKIANAIIKDIQVNYQKIIDNYKYSK